MGLNGVWLELLLTVVVFGCCNAGVKGGYGGQSRQYQQSYSQSAVSRTLCDKPESPMNGRYSCALDRDLYKCTGRCREGYKFPDGKEEIILICSAENGQWTPLPRFPDCVGIGSGSGSRSSFSKESQISSSASSHVSRTSCDKLESPMNGRYSCALDRDLYKCTGRCREGYTFPDGKEEIILICSTENGQWTPLPRFPDCVGIGSGSGSRSSFSKESRISSSSSSHVSRTPCDKPESPMNGRYSCALDRDIYKCTGRCREGYTFPDGKEEIILICSAENGQWTPLPRFPDCVGIGSGSGSRSSFSKESQISSSSSSHGSGSRSYTSSSTGQSSYSSGNRDSSGRGYASGSTGQGSYGANTYGSQYQQSSLGGGAFENYGQQVGRDLCGQPATTKNSAFSCRRSNDEWTCTVTCNGGYQFSDGSRQAQHTCNARDGRWYPKKEFEECQLFCHPACENGGRCATHNQCLCPPTHRGIRCQYATSLCDVKRFSPGSFYTNCTHLPEYSECTITCAGGMSFDPPSTSMFRCTVDGLWNPPVPPRCRESNLCKQPPGPKDGGISCRSSSSVMLCTATCRNGYEFPGDFLELTSQCNKLTGQWSPTTVFPDCQAICSPPCRNNGRCIGHNSCLCPREFRGSRCEYPLSNCDGHERFASVKWSCIMNSKETICDISCLGPSFKLQPSNPTRYTCSLDGSWQPDLKPICVEDYSRLIDARSQESHNQYSRSQQTHGDQRQMGHEFEGQRQMGHEFEGQRQMGHEFEGQRQMGHEFVGQRQIGQEFGGQRHTGQEFGGQEDYDWGDSFQGQKLVEPEFVSQKQTEYESGRPSGARTQKLENGFIGQEKQEEEAFEQIRNQKGYSEYDQDQITEDNIVSDRAESELGVPNPHVDQYVVIEDEKIGQETYEQLDEDVLQEVKNIDSDSNINTDVEIFSKKEKASDFRGICSNWGFYHYRTFDGDIYTFPSTCWYILAYGMEDGVTISTRNDCENKSPCSRLVSIQHLNDRYVISYDDGLYRNGVPVKIPVQDGDLVVEYISRYLVAKTNYGYSVWINNENSVLLVAEPYVQKRTQGMCGNYDGTSDPFFTDKNGEKTQDIFAFASSWKQVDFDGACVDLAEPKIPCNAETREKRMVQDKANLACAALYNHEFQECSKILDVDIYYAKCQMDCCSAMASEDCECSSLGEFVLECSRNGIDMKDGWRHPGLCPLKCTNGMKYRECGPPCAPTCSDQEPTCQQQKCVDGCHCPEGTVLEKGFCIPIQECPCTYGDKSYSTGDTVEQDCNTCLCQSGSWECTATKCPAVCSVSGPHFTTFDGFVYDHQGTCPHTLVDGDGFSVQVDYGTNCRGRTDNYYQACVKSITVHSPEDAVVKLKPSMEVTVNGREMTSLPVNAPGIYIGQATSAYIKAVLNNGLEIFWDLDSTIQIYAPVELFNKLRGLCGTFSNSQQDEFLTPEEDVESSVGAFTLKWRVEDSCRDSDEPVETSDIEKACDTLPQRRTHAARACSVIKGPDFKECHDVVEHERYYSDCMEDVCSCQEEPSSCVCSSLANYATACAEKGKPLSWRQNVPACGMACPFGQIYSPCASPCSYTCAEVAQAHDKPCRETCVEGCTCPQGQTLDDDGECVSVASCPCLHSGHYYLPEFIQRRGNEMCECSQGQWDCRPATPEDLQMTPPPPVTEECDPSSHLETTDCVSDCPLTCSNYHHYQPCTVAICVPGCRCQKGFILDATTGECVLPEECPCHHAGRSYEEGEEVKMGCNLCTCEAGSWKCGTASCPGLCSTWGDSHYETFDGRLYDFEGSCDYVLAKARLADNEHFSVVIQNAPCGLGSGATCGKTVSVMLGDSSVTLTRAHPLPSVSGNSRLSVSSVGMFTLVNSDIGLSVQWDHNTRVYITAEPIWKGKLQGLCGDFNSDASDDFRSPSGGKPLVQAKDFADSWRVHKFCPQAKPSQDACEKNPERMSWSKTRCGVLKSDLFKPCHYQVEVEDYFKRCVVDACACNSGGDCECLCAVVSAYAQKCARSGIVIPWRSQDVCPIQCEACDRYSPCISLCPPPNCDTYLDPPTSCAAEYCVDGCEPKPCKAGSVHRSAANLTCVPEETCDQKPCMVIDGVPYREGERMPSYEMADECQSCYCHGGLVKCKGMPCVAPSLTTPIPIFPEPEILCDYTGWTDWINSRSPEDNLGIDSESLDELLVDRRIPCMPMFVKAVECRAVLTQEPSAVTGQNVTCDTEHGLVCKKSAFSGDCLDYEMRVYCQCEEEECPPDQQKVECAFNCETSCHSLVHDLKQKGECQNDKCAEGCVKKICELPYVARDAQTCVTPDHCTCKLESGFLLAPGQVVTNGCEKCQCLNNTLICHQTLECQEKVTTPTTTETEVFEVITYAPTPKTRKEEKEPSRSLIFETTVPPCSFWSRWINENKPKKGKRHGDREDTRHYMIRQSEGFCLTGDVTAIECRDAETDEDYTQTNEEKLVCSLALGFACQNRHQPDLRCKDYKIRYFCSCSDSTTPVPLFIKTTTQAYMYSCSDFLPLIDGPEPLPDVSLKASSSYSHSTGPDASRMQKTKASKAWTPSKTNEKQFIEVDLGIVRGVYGIVTRGKQFSNEWVTSYQLLYSTDGVSYSYYQDEKDDNKIFSGNFDDSNDVKHIFKKPFEAKLVRIEPLSWERKISLKFELLGCSEALTTTPISEDDYEDEGRSLFLPTISTTPPPKECLDPIGLNYDVLQDFQFSASSSISPAHSPANGKSGSGSVWAPGQGDQFKIQHHFQIDFIDEANITGIQTKGDDSSQWITAFEISHSNNAETWTKIKNEDGNVKEFSGNYDATTLVTNEFPSMIRTRYFRIEPTKWKNWISLNIELLGCYNPQPCRDPMGLEEGKINIYQMSASSDTPENTADKGRLSSEKNSWTPNKKDKKQYIQIDLLEPQKVTAIVTKGDTVLDQWVTSYSVVFSNDGKNWGQVQNPDGGSKEFAANKDNDSPVINLLPVPITSRYIRIIPLKWHRWTSLRLELLGCTHEKICKDPMGLENGLVSDAQITASSSKDFQSTPSESRVSKNGWVAEKYDKQPYLQVDFLEPRNVSAVVTLGHPKEEYWVTKYKVLYKDLDDKWIPVTDDFGNVVKFTGNEDQNDPVVNTFPDTVESRVFRIVPLEWKDEIGLRLELLGCYHPYVCQEPLGLESGAIFDFQISASSFADIDLKPSNARLNSESTWVPELENEEPYLQVDLMEPTNITGVMTQGRNDASQWVTEFMVDFSMDGALWKSLEGADGNLQKFEGNSDSFSPVTNLFPAPLFARFLRIKPIAYETKIALRLEVLGCGHEKVCMEPMGLQQGLLSDSHITASSYESEETKPFKARLDSPTAWSASSVEIPQYLQVDFGDLRNVSAVVTKGDAREPEWVTSYEVLYSDDEEEWEPVKNQKGESIDFTGNYDNDSPVINVLPETITAQYIRIVPTDWKKWISLRLEVLGCYHPYEPVTLPPEAVLPMIVPPTPFPFAVECPNKTEEESSLLPDAILEASSSAPGADPSRILIGTRKEGPLAGGWVPQVDDLHPYIQVILPSIKSVTSIQIQGRSDEENWVKSLRVIASKDNVNWMPVLGLYGEEEISGNEDQESIVVHFFKKPMEAKYIKIIPETWHKWPSFRLDLKGCHLLEEPVIPLPMQMCPELADDPDLDTNCPEECPEGKLCDGQDCVDPVDCTCALDGRILKVSDKMEDHACRQCDCSLGGHSVCSEKVCPNCPEDQRSLLKDDCTCECKSCEENQKMCPSNHECIPKQRWCDGIIDCPDDETNCIYTTTTPYVEITTVPPTPPEPENATCDVMGKHIKTFDGQDIAYEICHHYVMKDTVRGVFNVTLHKKCDYTGDCKHWMQLRYKRQNVTVFSDMKVEFNGHSYSASQLPRINKKSKAKNIHIDRIGDQVEIKHFNRDFKLVYDNKGHLKIEVTPALQNRIGGLCGFYNGVPSDDQKKPSGKAAFTSQEFGDSWAVDENGKDCAPVICPHDVMAKALDQCNKLREDPFGECNKVLPVDNFIEFCISSTCECVIQKNATGETCKCDSFQPFAEACEEKLGPTAIRNWRFKHECNSECPPGQDWNDCGPSCQLTCDSSETSLEHCSEKCVPGCFCPPGTVLHDDKCIPPEQCSDQMCQGFGDPHFRTFDGLFFPFVAEGSFLIVGDKNSDFVLNGFSRKCNLFSTMTCLTGIEIIYKGHKVTFKKHKDALVDDVSIPMDHLPLHSHGMLVLGYPGRTFVVFIPQMNLEARYYEDNSGFAVRVPSKKYFNRTEGLCGNCNGRKDDELENKPLSEFVCSQQIEGDVSECEKSMEELPEITDRVPLCEQLESPVFEACFPLVDVEVYVDACSFDANHSGKETEAFCKTAMEYARQCCQAGITIDDWPEALDCGMKCGGDLVYKQCHQGCPQTCESLKNASESASCNDLKVDGCFCPEGKILKDTNCMEALTCETCDEEGHVAGDKWEEGNCKTCKCKNDLTIECTVEVCPPKPICSVHETLAKIPNESSCCESFSCVEKKRNCPIVEVPECSKGEVAKARTRSDLCTNYECECDITLCQPVIFPTNLDEGQVAEIVNDSCCRTVKVTCHPYKCPEKPKCRKGLHLIENEAECCTKYKCKIPDDICVYNHAYKIVDGSQVKLQSGDSTPALYKPGEEWEDGLCEKCKCTESNGQFAPLCTLEQCPRLEDMPENKDFVLHELKIPGKCCPDVFRIQCKHDNEIYEPGEQWDDPNDPCVHYVCEKTVVGDVQKTKSIINCTDCPRTAVYFAPSKILGQCCGICRVTKCEDGDDLYTVGETWTNDDEPCRKAECVSDHDVVKTVYTRQPCPAIPKDCPENKIVMDEKGCCEICNITSEISCNSSPIPERDTVGYFTFYDESNGGKCVNEKPVPNVLKCSGACHSSSYYSLEDGDFKEMCKCCKVNVTVNRTIELLCPNRNYIKKTFLQPETCQCSKCAPKDKPNTKTWNKVERITNESPFSQKPWEKSDYEQHNEEIGQFVQQEDEQQPLQNMFGNEVQQNEDEYDVLQQQKYEQLGQFVEQEDEQQPMQNIFGLGDIQQNEDEYSDLQQKHGFSDMEETQQIVEY